MRRAGNIDANQPSIVRVLRAVGASVQVLSGVGQGCPDILVGFRGRSFAIEIKDGSKPPSERRLTPDQEKWHREWRGDVHVVKDESEALRAIGLHVGEGTGLVSHHARDQKAG